MDSMSVEQYGRMLVERYFSQDGYEDLLRSSAVVMAGSQAIGIADDISDLDLYVFAPENVYAPARKLAERRQQTQVGAEWHMQYLGPPIEATIVVFSYTEFANEFTVYPSQTLAGFNRAMVWQDPSGQFATTLAKHQAAFQNSLTTLVRHRTLSLRQRIKHVTIVADRGLRTSVALVKAEFVRSVLELAFLFEGRPFCHLKQLETRAVSETELGEAVCGELTAILAEGTSVGEAQRRMVSVYLRVREAGICSGVDDPDLTNPEGTSAARHFEHTYLTDFGCFHERGGGEATLR